MTTAKKGRRRVRVGEVDYAWSIRRQPTYLQAAFQSTMRLAIQPCDARGQSVLVINLGVSRPDNWIGPHQTAVTPAMVREMIAAALAAGWQPFQATEPFFWDYPLVRDRA